MLLFLTMIAYKDVATLYFLVVATFSLFNGYHLFTLDDIDRPGQLIIRFNFQNITYSLWNASSEAIASGVCFIDFTVLFQDYHTPISIFVIYNYTFYL